MSHQSLSLHGAIKSAYVLARWYVKRARANPHLKIDSVRAIKLFRGAIRDWRRTINQARREP
jgi:hypothetical protein